MREAQHALLVQFREDAIHESVELECVINQHAPSSNLMDRMTEEERMIIAGILSDVIKRVA